LPQAFRDLCVVVAERNAPRHERRLRLWQGGLGVPCCMAVQEAWRVRPWRLFVRSAECVQDLVCRHYFDRAARTVSGEQIGDCDPASAQSHGTVQRDVLGGFMEYGNHDDVRAWR
jgi:hypothetical protein